MTKLVTQETKVDSKFTKVGKLKEVNGSILSPQFAGLRLVLSANNLSGVTEVEKDKKKVAVNELLALFNKKWAKVREEARGWYASQKDYKLGNTLTTAVQSDTWVVHMLCQDKDRKLDKKALDSCLKKVADLANYEKASVHVSEFLLKEMPELQKAVQESLVNAGVNVYLYKE